ncbi:MAG TPA: alpha/beta hydrolase [Streptosporangiaceae bacterium]
MHNADYLTIDGRLAYVEVFGDSGPAVFCIHTAGQNGVQYRYVAPALAAIGYRAVVADLPGHGRSEPAAGGPVTNLRYYGDWCLRVIDSLGLNRPYVLGCSIGGAIAMHMAVLASGSLAGIVAMATVDFAAMPRRPRALVLEDSGSPSIRDRTYYGALDSCGRIVPPERIELIATMHCREDWHVTFADGTAMEQLDLWDELPAITCPTLVAAGTDDPFFPPACVRATAERIPGVHFELLDGVAHYPIEEMPDLAQHFARWVHLLTSEVPA